MKEYDTKVLIQGFEGSNHDLAAREYFGDQTIEVLPCLTFNELFDKLHNNSALLGLVAMENTLAGSLLPNYRLLRNSGFQILGEHKMRISHHLMALPGQKINMLSEVHSHPLALAQCEDFLLQNKHLRLVASEDTALSAKMIRRMSKNGIAAIAPRLAAHHYGLEILAENIESNPHNYTRFLLVGSCDNSTKNIPLEADTIDKASLVFSLSHESGSLSRLLSVLAFYGMNLTKIQSMPVVGKEWQYLFYIDLQFTDFHRYGQSIDAIRPLAKDLEILGAYQTFELRTLSSTMKGNLV